jgi:hypothetical protein
MLLQNCYGSFDKHDDYMKVSEGSPIKNSKWLKI